MTSPSRRVPLPLAVAIAAALAAPPRAAAAEQAPRVYQLVADVAGARVEVRVNGFPVGKGAGGEGGTTVLATLNPYLAGARNVVEVVLDAPRAPDGKPLPLQDPKLELSVRRFEQGGIVEPGAGDAVASYALPPEVAAELAAGKRALPFTVTQEFKSEGADFSAELRDAPPFADEAALREYAMKLRGLAAKKDAKALLAEFEPKARAYAAAFGQPYPMFRDSLGAALQQLVGSADLAFGKDDLELRPWCGGRIWELARKGGVALLRSKPGGEMQSSLPVYVAPRDGKLRVVR